MTNFSPAVLQAAAQLHSLINERPFSPTHDEIASIMAKAVTPQPLVVSSTSLHAEIASVASEYREAFCIDDDPRIEPLRRRLGELAEQLARVPTVTEDGRPIPAWSIANVAAWADIALAYAMEEGNSSEPFCHTCSEQNDAVANLVFQAMRLRDMTEVSHG